MRQMSAACFADISDSPAVAVPSRLVLWLVCYEGSHLWKGYVESQGVRV